MQWGLLVEFSCNSPIRYLIALLRALLVVRSFVLEWRVVATTSKRIPTRKMWDYTVDVQERLVLRKKNIYLLSREKREEMHEFIEKQEYIKLLKSHQMALVFFIEKKNGKMIIVQDYRCLNKWTVKNNYSLPLISNIIKNISPKKVFNKLDLYESYNNV